MHIELENEPDTLRFQIKIIEKIAAPNGMVGENWYRYIVGQNGRDITGFKTGTLKSVTEHVEIFTEGLNERNASGASPGAHTARGVRKTWMEPSVHKIHVS